MSQSVTATTFYGQAEFKPPGWAGFTQGLSETHAKTPANAQYHAKHPVTGEFLHLAKQIPCAKPSRDPCNDPNTYKSVVDTPNLWPGLQTKGRQPSCKPPSSNIELGDQRIRPYATTYAMTFSAPLKEGATIRSPLYNESLSRSDDLRQQYHFAMQRVGEKRLKDILSHMRDRFYGRIGNKSDNAFRLRKFAKMFDVDHTGYIGLEDFRVMTEAGGMQLDDDSLLALFSKYDTLAEGRLRYLDVMRDVLDEDALALFMGGSETKHSPELSLTFRPK